MKRMTPITFGECEWKLFETFWDKCPFLVKDAAPASLPFYLLLFFANHPHPSVVRMLELAQAPVEPSTEVGKGQNLYQFPLGSWDITINDPWLWQVIDGWVVVVDFNQNDAMDMSNWLICLFDLSIKKKLPSHPLPICEAPFSLSFTVPFPKTDMAPGKIAVGRQVSFWDGPFSGDTLVQKTFRTLPMVLVEPYFVCSLAKSAEALRQLPAGIIM